MRNPFCVGERIYLRPLEVADAALLAACNNDPEVRISFFTHTPVSILAQEETIRGLYKEGATYLPLAICLKDGDVAIGVTAWHRIDQVSRAAVYSICICEGAHRGQGYASEVTDTMLRYAFDVLNFHRVHLHVWVGNEAGVRAYEKCGFIREGTLREAMRHNGVYCDFHVMGILESDWRARKQ